MTEPASALLTLCVPARLEHVTLVVRAVGSVASLAGLEDTRRARLELAVAETLANIVRHAYADRENGAIDVRVESGAVESIVELRDSGRPLGLAEVGGPRDSGAGVDGVPESGRGLWIMRQAVSSANYRREGDANVWRLVQRSTD